MSAAESRMPVRIWAWPKPRHASKKPDGGWESWKDYDDAIPYIRSDLVEPLVEALRGLVEAKALSGVRDLVAGWNGENRADGPYKERHPSRLGATLPKTNCGDVYALDEAMQRANAALSSWEAAQ